MMRKALLMGAVVLLVAFNAFAYQVPEYSSQAKYFYVFGTEGDPYLGADDVDHTQVLFIDVPAEEMNQVLIEVYDPDTGGMRDLKPTPDKPWDTKVEFAVYGSGSKELGKQEFAESPEYDRAYYTFGPYNKESGEKVGDVYRFKLVTKALAGLDQNLFSVKVSPNSVETFSDKVNFRLLPYQGDQMFFYPEIPAGTTRIIVKNYDLDPDGGIAELHDRYGGNSYKLNNSASAEWAETPIDIESSSESRRLDYVVTKMTQRYANAAVKVEDEKGNALPIYFRKGKTPVKVVPVVERPAPVPEIACNTFLFDATDSSDPDRQKLSYLWEFGDGTTSDQGIVTHTYAKAGDYKVTLSVKDTSGLACDTDVTTQSVHVNTPPTPELAGPDKACAGQSVTFDASGTDDDTPSTVTYKWTFGDGTTAEGSKVTKTFDKGGVYKVNLLVDDNAGTKCSTASMSTTIAINSAPVADAEKDMSLCVPAGRDFTVSLSGSGSRDPDGDALDYSWDFGDGSSAEGSTVSHTYKNAGTYKATLTVDDGFGSSCSTSMDSVNIELNRHPIAAAGADVSDCAGSSVSFDGSESKGEGSLSYTWDFGDGSTGSGAKVSHVFDKGGSYRVTLTVDDGKNTACSRGMDALVATINAGPTAALEVVPDQTVCLGTSVTLDASGSTDPDNDALKYTWDFGDGSVSESGSKVTHKYAKGGSYTVRVTVDDNSESVCAVDSATTTVDINTPPVANVGPNLVCCLDQQSSFDGSQSYDDDGDSLTYNWSFGDGTTAQGPKVTHSYNKIGTYKVVLTVDDGSGTECSTDEDSFTATVNAAPTSVIKIINK